MPGKSQSHTDAVLNILRGSAVAGVTPYVGLFSVAPADDNSAGTELAGDGYARQAKGRDRSTNGNSQEVRAGICKTKCCRRGRRRHQSLEANRAIVVEVAGEFIRAVEFGQDD